MVKYIFGNGIIFRLLSLRQKFLHLVKMCDEGFSRLIRFILKFQLLIPKKTLKICGVNPNVVLSVIVICSTVSALVLCNVDKLRFDRAFILFSDLLRIVISCLTSTINCFSIIVAQILYKDSWKVLADTLLITKHSTRRSDILFFIMTSVYHAKYISIYVLSNKSFHTLLHTYQIDIVNDYTIVMVAVLINNYANGLKDVVILIKQKFNEEFKLLIKRKGLNTSDSSLLDINSILKIAIQVLRGINVFNKLFGWQILGVCILILLNTSHNVIIILQLVLKEHKLKYLQDSIRSSIGKVVRNT